MTILDEIRSRGHVVFVIRPQTFNPTLVEHTQLEPLLRRTAVQLRGWDMPHIDPHESVRNKSDHIEQQSSWNNHLEHWEFYSSGQFADLTSIRADWLDRSSLHTAPSGWRRGQTLPVTDTVFTITEIFELAARLAVTPAGDSHMVVSISFRGMAGRVLTVDDTPRVPFAFEYRYDDERIDLSTTISRERLAGEAWDLAAECTLNLFSHFNWKPSIEVIQGSQEELRGVPRRDPAEGTAPSLSSVSSAFAEAGLIVEVAERPLALTASAEGGIAIGIYIFVGAGLAEFARVMVDDTHEGLRALLRRFRDRGSTHYTLFVARSDETVNARLDADLPPQAYLKLQGPIPPAPSGLIVYDRTIGKWRDSEEVEI